MVRISLVIPMYNALDTLPRLLASIEAQTLPRDQYEVIIVDDGSTDGSGEIVRRHSDIRLLSQQNRGPAAARNLGTRAATGVVIAYTDADCVLKPDWLAKHIELHERHPGIDGLSGSVAPATELPYGSVVLADHLCSWFNVHDRLPEREPEHLPSLMMSVKRRMFDAGIWWTERRITGEDVDFCKRMVQCGMKLRYFPTPVLQHVDRSGFREFLRHQYNWGFHAPFVRGQSKDAAYSFLFPGNMIGAWLCAPLIVMGYTALIIKAWWRTRPLGLASALPLIVLGKLSYARGVLHGTRARRTGMEGIVADRRAPSTALPTGG